MRLPDLIFHTMVNMGEGEDERGERIIPNSEGFEQGTARERLGSQGTFWPERQRWSGRGLLRLVKNG